jgi:hypothetical protein
MTEPLSCLHTLPSSLFHSPTLVSASIPSLINLCIDKLIDLLQSSNYHPQQINELCKILSPFQHLLDPILVQLLQKKAITDVALIAFLVPDRHQLVCPEVVHIKNSTLKMIGYNCPNLVYRLHSTLLTCLDDFESH